MKLHRVQKVFTDIYSDLHIIYLGYDQECTWQLFLHSNPKEETAQGKQEQIIGHDVITIKHSELDGYLCSSLNFKSEYPEVYFRTYQGTQQEEVVSVSADYVAQLLLGNNS
jgi:hypothetical protein